MHTGQWQQRTSEQQCASFRAMYSADYTPLQMPIIVGNLSIIALVPTETLAHMLVLMSVGYHCTIFVSM